MLRRCAADHSLLALTCPAHRWERLGWTVSFSLLWDHPGKTENELASLRIPLLYHTMLAAVGHDFELGFSGTSTGIPPPALCSLASVYNDSRPLDYSNVTETGTDVVSVAVTTSVITMLDIHRCIFRDGEQSIVRTCLIRTSTACRRSGSGMRQGQSRSVTKDRICLRALGPAGVWPHVGRLSSPRERPSKPGVGNGLLLFTSSVDDP
jgi:hypothetical protein